MPTTVNITTLNQLVSNLQDIADKHQQINGFQYGEPWEFYQSGMTNSPELWVMCTGFDRQRGTTIFNLTMYLADNVKRGESNELEVESDLIQIAEDIMFQLQNNDYGWNVPKDDPVSYKLMTERTPKNLTVVEFNVSIRIKKAANICAIPFSSTPTTGVRAEDGFVTIYNLQTGATITTVNVNNSYGVYQFSTIDGGASNTTFTDIIVAN